MPISHKYKLIFIHIPKCAGISVWHALDLTFTADNLISVTHPILQHLLPKQLKDKYIDSETWNTYSKFTIIRNPYDRTISDYFWMKDNAEAKTLVTGTFDDFLTLREDIVNNNRYAENIYFDHFYPMYFYFEGVKFDQIIRFENIDEDYEQLRQTYNIENKLPRINESNRTGFVLNKLQKKRIYELYKRDFVQFGYSEKYESVKLWNNGAPAENESNEEVSTNILAPIQKSKLQIFWAGEEMQFSEIYSQHKIIELNSFSQSFSFNIVENETAINYLRFDIGNQVGAINIHSINVQGIEGTLLWTWNPNDIIGKNDVVLIENEENFQNKTIQLSFSDDPQLLLKLPDLNRKELVIEMSLSSLNVEQTEVLNKSITKPLSFYSSQDHLSFQNEKENLTKEIKSLNESLLSLRDKNTSLGADIESKEQILKELISTKTFEEEELKFKNEIINKSFVEKEKLENLLFKASAEIKVLGENIFEKEKRVLKSELEVAQLIGKLTFLEKVLNDEKEKFNRQLKKVDQLSLEKNDFVKKLSDALFKVTNFELLIAEKDESILRSESYTAQLSSKVEYLENAIRQENFQITELNKIIEGLQNELSGNRIILKEKDIEILKYVTKELNQKSSQIGFYKRVYENRKLLGIIKDRLLKLEKN